MSITPKMLQGASGEVQDQILAGVLYCYWSRSRIHYGEEVHLGAVISGWADGTAVKLVVYEYDGGGAGDDLVCELDAKIDKGIATTKTKIEYEDPDSDEGGEYQLYFKVEIDGKPVSEREQCPYLLVDMTLPLFGE
ncbi:MAG: hypothetical protein AB7N76_04255 [Planctomycetota bacterium]